MRKISIVFAVAAVCLLTTSCASKKELQNCQTENKQLTTDYQSAKEQLAANQVRISSLEEQLAEAKSSRWTRV